MILLLFVLSVLHLVSSDNECIVPEFKNGKINAQGNTRAWSGHFECDPGYLLYGRKILKCRDGIWSSSPPVCTAVGICDPTKLPEIANGKKIEIKQFRGALERYECIHGYRLHGQRQVHCTSDGWNIQEYPICASLDCDDTLVERIEHGKSKKLSKGSVYRYRCEPGSVLVGSSLVYCNNGKWNDTAPRCTVGPVSVTISAPDYIHRGNSARISCESSESNPPAEIIWQVRDQHGQDITEDMEITPSQIDYKPLLNGWTARSELEVPDYLTWQINRIQVKCTGLNEEGRNSVENITDIHVYYPPSSVRIHGQDHAREGTILNLECVSAPS
jgi:hypothetical protein